MVLTMNGRARIDVADARLTTTTAGGLSTKVAAGDTATVLQHAARRFHTEVEPLSTFYGWRSLAVNTASGGIATSNHLSGTALDLNGAQHPRYKHGTFTADERAALERILDDVTAAAGERVVRWGGDGNSDGKFTEADVDEMHIEIVGTAAGLALAAAAIRAGSLVSDRGTTTPATPTPRTRSPDPRRTPCSCASATSPAASTS